MIAQFGKRDRSAAKLRTVRVPATRDQFVSKAATWWVGTVIAVTLLWCGCALAAEPRVILLRGWFGVFSTGLDGLADELKNTGINAEVEGHLYWSTAVSDILRERAAGKIRPLVLVGHSQGANNVIDMARSLDEHKIPVDLLVTLAPFLQHPVPANVARAVNYYQSPGWGAPLSGDNNFHGKLLNVDVADDPTILHISIDKSARIHAEILREIAALAQAKQ
jgi:pimeloyl-ACP methyl ester carboxylesterase